MTLATVGDGLQVGDGNANETLNLGVIAAKSVKVGAATSLVGFYGKTPVVIRPFSSAVHCTSAASVSSSFGATQLAILQEIQNTFVGLGIWATV